METTPQRTAALERESASRRVIWTSGLVLALSVGVVALDVLLPADVTIGILYVIPIAACIGFRSERAVYAITPLVILLSLIALEFGPAPADPNLALLNRGIAVIAQLGLAALAVIEIRHARQHEEDRRRLAQLLNMKTTFIRAVSHDIRGPVGTMVGLAEWMLDPLFDPQPQPKQAELLRRIARSGNGVVALTHNLLTAAQLDADDFPVATAPVDLATLVRDVASDHIIATGTEAGVRFDTPDSLTIESDAMRVRQIVANLISNARKFSPGDRPIEVAISSDGDAAVVTVRDYGPGILPEDRERIFEPFYRTAAGRSREGFGLGLSLARRLARRLGGNLTVESTPGKGSTFTLRLPLSRRSAETLPAESAAQSPPGASVRPAAAPGARPSASDPSKSATAG